MIDTELLEEHGAVDILMSGSDDSVDFDSSDLSECTEDVLAELKKVEASMLAAASRHDYQLAGEIQSRVRVLKSGLAKRQAAEGADPEDVDLMMSHAHSMQRSIILMPNTVMPIVVVSKDSQLLVVDADQSPGLPKLSWRQNRGLTNDWQSQIVEFALQNGLNVNSALKFGDGDHIFLALSTNDMPHISGMSWIDLGLAQLALWSTLHIRFVQEACQSFGLPHGCTVTETKRNLVQYIKSGSDKKECLDTNAQMMQEHIGDFSVENDVCQLLVFNQRWSLLTGLQPDGSHIVPLVKVLGWRKSAADFATSFGLLCIDVMQLSYPEDLDFSQMAPWVVLVVDSKQQNCSNLSLQIWNWLPI